MSKHWQELDLPLSLSHLREYFPEYTHTLNELTSEMIHASSWGEPERAMHCWFVMAHKPCTVSNSRNHHCMHVCCSMSVVSKTPCSQAASISGENYSQDNYYGYTNAWTKLHTEVMS